MKMNQARVHEHRLLMEMIVWINDNKDRQIILRSYFDRFDDPHITSQVTVIIHSLMYHDPLKGADFVKAFARSMGYGDEGPGFAWNRESTDRLVCRLDLEDWLTIKQTSAYFAKCVRAIERFLATH